jgi:hypothetical protein
MVSTSGNTRLTMRVRQGPLIERTESPSGQLWETAMINQMTSGQVGAGQQYSASLHDGARSLGRAFGAMIERHNAAVERRRADAELRRTPVERLRHLGIERARLHQAVDSSGE